MINRIIKIAGWILLAIGVVILLLWLLLKVPAVQNATADYVTRSLSKALKTEVAIDEVSFKLFKEIRLHGFLIRDLRNDTLLSVAEAHLDLKHFNWWNRDVFFQNIEVSGFQLHLDDGREGTPANYQFLMDYFETDTSNSTRTPWSFGLAKLKLSNGQFERQNEAQGNDLEVKIGQLLFYPEDINLEESKIAVRQLALSESDLIFHQGRLSDRSLAPRHDTIYAPLVFPDLGWALTVKQILIENNKVLYVDQNYPHLKNRLDFNHLHADEINLFASDFTWTDSQISAEVKSGHFTDAGGFVLDDFSGKLSMDTNQINLNNIVFKTPLSELQNSTKLIYSTFSDLRDFTNLVDVHSNFAEGRIAFEDLNYLVPGFQEATYINTELDAEIDLQGTVTGTINALNFRDFSAGIDHLLRLRLDGGIRNLSHPTDLAFNANVRQLSTSYAALETLTRNAELPEAIRPWGTFDFEGVLEGTLDDLTANNVKLQTGSVTGFQGDIKIKNLTHPTQRSFALNVDALKSTSSDLAGFSIEPFPPAFDSLGVFYYQGSFNGTIQDFRAKGDLVSEAGKVQTDIMFNFLEDFSDATFSGDIAMDSFDLGRILADTNVGALSLEVNIFGSGLDFDHLRATVLGSVQELEYRNYLYRDLNVDGRFIQRKFVGNASVADPNLGMRYEGVVNFADSSARFKFDLNVDTINFMALNLSPQPLGMRAFVSSDFYGNDFNSMQGEVFISDLILNNAFNHHLTDSIYIFSDNEQANARKLKIRSPHFIADVDGSFTPAELPALFVSIFDQYFPFSAEAIAQSDSIRQNSNGIDADPQSFDFQFKLLEAGGFLSIFSPSFTLLDSLTLEGHLNTSDGSSSLFGYLHQLEFNEMSVGPASLTSIGDGDVLDNVLTVNNAQVNENLQFPFLYMDATLLNDTAYVSSVFQDEVTGGEKLSFAGMASHIGNAYKLEFNRAFTLNDETWEVDPANAILFGKGDLSIDQLSLARDSQSLKIQSRDLAWDGVTAPIDLVFSDFELKEVGSFLSIEDLFYEGKINGKVTLQDLSTDIKYLADLKLNDLTLKEEEVGDLVIQSRQRTKDVVDILVRLEGGKSGLDIRGNYNLATANISLKGEVDRLSLSAIDPFLEGTIHESEGEVSGLLSIDGSLDAPTINGNIELDEISTIFDFLQGRYSIENENITIDNNRISLDGVVVLDPEGNRAELNGYALYRGFDDTKLAIDLKSDKFQILNTTYRDNDLYYGQIFVDADVQIAGEALAPKFIVNAKTLAGTKFYMQPLGDEFSYAQENFIIYANPADFEEDTTLSINDLYTINTNGIDLTANIVLTPEAELEIIIDPLKGDKLVCHGNADLSVEISPQGVVNVLGSYSITEGSYDFNFQKVLKRNFTIEPGSSVNFIGDPLRSRFDIEAIYPVKTTTYELIRNQSTLSATEENLSRQRSDVEVKLNLRGDLERPEASFDIDIPNARSDAVSGSVISKLNQLRENEADMNKQVFGLLILNSFIAEEQATGADLIADAGQSAFLGSVSSLVSNELNKLAKRYIKGVDLDFGFDSYSNTSDALVTELEVGLSKRLLNDRLTVRLGGNFQFDNQEDFDLVSQQNATFSGDFILEYKLSPSGNYNLKFFQALSNEENVLSPGANYSETGVSLLFTKSFNSKRYLLQLEENEEEVMTGNPKISNE